MTRRGRYRRRRNSVGRGGRITAELKKIDTDRGCPNLKEEDIAEKPRDSLKITKLPSSTSSSLHVDLFSQARKLLSFRSPFDSDDSTASQPASFSRPNNLPSRVSNLLCRHSDIRKRQKKPYSGTEKKSSVSAKPPRGNSIWQETEDYFRELTVADIEKLESVSNYGRSIDDHCFLIPHLNEDNLRNQVEYLGEIHPNACQKNNKLEDFVGPNTHASVRTDGNLAETKECEIKSRNYGDNWQNGKRLSDSFSGVEWILGSRSKIYVSLERPSKKRKLMSRDAGLERLLTTRPVEGLSSICHYCSYGDMGDPLNCLIRCSSCGMVVHQRCYGVQEEVDSFWSCSWCKSKNNGVVSTDVPCLLCPKQGGALKPVKLRGIGSESDGCKMEFAHLFCCLWMPEVYLENTRSMEPIMNVNELKDTRKKLICSLCKVKHGNSVRCSNGSCRTSFHPICAREARYRLEVWGKLGSDEVELCAFCLKHSEVQHDGNSQDTGDSSLTSDCVSNDYFVSELYILGSQLVDLGKVSLEVVASEIGAAPHSVTMALTDKHSNPDVHCKLVRWLINHAHFGNLQKTFKQKIKLFMGMKENSENADGGCNGSAADSSVCDALLIKSTPRRRTKSGKRLVKDDETGASRVEGDSDKVHIKVVAHFTEIFFCDIIDLLVSSFQILIDPDCNDIADIGSGVGTEGDNHGLSYRFYFYDMLLRALDGDASQSEYNLPESSAGVTTACDAVNLEESTSARNQDIIKLSPADEVEGELVYYQQRLLRNFSLRKRLCDELLSRIVKGVAEEIATAARQKWDSVLINQYNYYQKENKKHGRNERRHKEAQAVLAAATAAAATSSRTSSTRKDKLEESYQQDHLKMKVSDSGTAFNPQLSPFPKESNFRSRSSSEKDSGLVQSSSSLSKSHSRICDICNRYETVLNPVLTCSGCKVSVHFDCYRSDKKTSGPWRCELCEDLSESSRAHSSENPYFAPECGLCGGTAGAFRKSRDGEWIHALCAEWILDSYRRGQVNPVEELDSVCKGTEFCTVCHRKQGVCVKCSYGYCHTMFHPICARSAGFYMNLRTSGGKVQHKKAYCEKHSTEQKAKAETQKSGVEELRSLKQVRVELERLRLLCERIVKREKLKRELLVCSHDVLASSRDSVLSTLVRHPFYQPEVSSESATTTTSHKDHHMEGGGYRSKVQQRADNVSVDCTVAGKRRVRLPVLLDNDQITDSSSDLRSERVLFSGKQIPHRP
ncbi:hypothetical protein M569_02683, partial [Genlisea aurea]